MLGSRDASIGTGLSSSACCPGSRDGMKRTPMRRTGRLRPQSKKAQQGAEAFKGIYREVDQRSGGRCEYRARIERELSGIAGRPFDFLRCRKAATDHHHLFRPRRSNHRKGVIVHLCRGHHDRCGWPFKDGRLMIDPVDDGFRFRIVWAESKFALCSRGGMKAEGT